MKTGHADIQSEITEVIIEALERGAGQFELPWAKSGLKSPVNFISTKTYRGTNLLLLLLTAHARGYSDPRWATFKQWQQSGAVVRKGERGTPIVFYKMLNAAEPAFESHGTPDRAIPLLRHSYVFNICQVEGVPEDAMTPSNSISPVEAVKQADQVIAATGAVIRHHGDRAYYRPATDEIAIPTLDLWQGTSTSTATEAYYSTLLHELVHWTGSPARLDRIKSCSFGSPDYCREELVAELGAAFSCVELGITPVPRPDHAAYIAQYIELLKGDKRAIFKAASAASLAVDFIMRRSAG